jgi:hypothetical protein
MYNDATIVDIIGTPKLSFTLWKDESYYNGDNLQIKKEVFTKCLSDDLNMVSALKKSRQVKLTGNLNESKNGHRNMAVTHIELTELMTPNDLPDEDAF